MITDDNAASNDTPGNDMLGGCCVCSDEEGWADNSLVYCDGDGCSVAVHQACYGILRVPEGDWYCRRCEAVRNGSVSLSDVQCELCHHREGALKPTESGKWCHVLCALYIPEATFGDVQAMEPIILKNVQKERFGRTCSLCNRNEGACTQCSCSSATNSSNHGKVATTCSTLFHVTCAQIRGLLCELQIGGTTRYPTYCEEHMKTLKPGLKVKRLPPFKGPPGNISPSGTPALRSRRKESSERVNGATSPASNSDDYSDHHQSKPSKAGSTEGSKHSSHKEKEKESRHSAKYKEERRKAKLLKKKHAENGQSSDKKDKISVKSTEKKRGRQKSSKKHSLSFSSSGDSKGSPVPSNGGNGMVLIGKLSTEAAIRVRHASGKDSEHPSDALKNKSADAPAVNSSINHKVDLWSLFSQKKTPDDIAVASSSSGTKKPASDSLDALLEETFWRDTGRFLLTEIQQTAPADIVELLHALYQVELENQQLEAKIASMSTAADAQRLTAARLSVPLNSTLPPTLSKSNSVQALPLNGSSSASSNSVLPQHSGSNASTGMPPPVSSTIGSSGLSSSTCTVSNSHPSSNSFTPKLTPASSSGPSQPKLLPPTMPATYAPNDVAAMQQMQLQLYQHLYQQQLQQHMQPTGGSGPLPQQPKLEIGPPFSCPIPMSLPLMPPQQSSASSVLPAISTQPQQQQRSLPMQLIEPAPSTSNLMPVGNGSSMPPEVVLVPPPPQLLSAPVSVSSNISNSSPVTSSGGLKRSADASSSTSNTKAQVEASS